MSYPSWDMIRNGTFVRIKGAQELFHGDYLFVGQQLFRVEIS